MEFNFFQTLASTFASPVEQNQFTHAEVFNKTPVRESAIAMISNYASTEL